MLAISNLYSFTCLFFKFSFSACYFMAETMLQKPPLGLMLCGVFTMCIAVIDTG